MSGSLLAVTGLQARYGKSRVLFDVAFEVGHAQVVTLLGRNGMDKATTVATIMGTLPSRTGSICPEGSRCSLCPRTVSRSVGWGWFRRGGLSFPI